VLEKVEAVLGVSKDEYLEEKGYTEKKKGKVVKHSP